MRSRRRKRPRIASGRSPSAARQSSTPSSSPTTPRTPRPGFPSSTSAPRQPNSSAIRSIAGSGRRRSGSRWSIPTIASVVARATEHNWRTGRPWSIRYRMIRSDGSVIWLMDAGRMLERDSLGRPCDLPGDPARRDRGRGGEDAPRFVRTRAAARARGRAGDPVVRDDPSGDRARALHVHRPAGARDLGIHAGRAHGREHALPADGPSRRSVTRAGERDSLRGDRDLGGHLPGPPA